MCQLGFYQTQNKGLLKLRSPDQDKNTGLQSGCAPDAAAWIRNVDHIWQALEKHHQQCLRKIHRIRWVDQYTNVSIVEEADTPTITAIIEKMPGLPFRQNVLQEIKKRYKDNIKAHIKNFHIDFKNWAKQQPTGRPGEDWSVKALHYLTTISNMPQQTSTDSGRIEPPPIRPNFNPPPLTHVHTAQTYTVPRSAFPHTWRTTRTKTKDSHAELWVTTDEGELPVRTSWWVRDIVRGCFCVRWCERKWKR